MPVWQWPRILFAPQGAAKRTSPPVGGEQRAVHGTDEAGPGALGSSAPRGRNSQRGTSCFKANLSRIQALPNHPPEAPPCWPLGASSESVRRTDCQANPTQPRSAYPDLILLLLGDLLLAPLSDILKNREGDCYTEVPASPLLSSALPSPQLTGAVFLFLAWMIWASWGESVWLGWGCCLACKRLLRWIFKKNV